MNERTIDLYKQSIEFAYNSIGKEHSNTAYFQGTIVGKFAELIVRECCNMMMDLEVKYPANLTVREIKKSFGIE